MQLNSDYPFSVFLRFISLFVCTSLGGSLLVVDLSISLWHSKSLLQLISFSRWSKYFPMGRDDFSICDRVSQISPQHFWILWSFSASWICSLSCLGEWNCWAKHKTIVLSLLLTPNTHIPEFFKFLKVAETEIISSDLSVDPQSSLFTVHLFPKYGETTPNSFMSVSYDLTINSNWIGEHLRGHVQRKTRSGDC